MKIITLPIVAVLVAGVASSAAAYQLQPMSRVLAPSGSAATQPFELVNDGPERIAVQLSVATLDRDENYVESGRPADDDFLVHPAQVIIAPGGHQTVRVTWLGDPSPAHELAYRLVAEQLPIELLDPSARSADRAVGAVKVMLSYRASLFVRPRNATPKMEIASAEPTHGPDGVVALALTVKNAGTATGLITGCTVHVVQPEKAGTRIDLGPADVAPLLHTRILPGHDRRYLLPWPAVLQSGPLAVEGRCDSER